MMRCAWPHHSGVNVCLRWNLPRRPVQESSDYLIRPSVSPPGRKPDDLHASPHRAAIPNPAVRMQRRLRPIDEPGGDKQDFELLILLRHRHLLRLRRYPIIAGREKK